VVGEGLNGLDHPVFVIEIDDVDRIQSLGCRDASEWCKPEASVRFNGKVFEQRLQLAGCAVSDDNAQAQKALPGLVVYTILSGLDHLRLLRKLNPRGNWSYPPDLITSSQ
jgi:hypothetical protein